MVTHLVAFRWKPDAPAGHGDAVREALLEFVAGRSEVRSYQCGSDLGLATSANHDFGVVATFDDAADWDVYMKDPDHDRIRAELIVPWLAERTMVQFGG